MEKAIINQLEKDFIKDKVEKANLMVMESLNIKMETNIKVNGLMIKKMDKGNLHGLMTIINQNIMENLKIIS